MDQKLMFAQRVKSLRKSKQLTQQQMADQMELSVDAVSNLERAKSLPSFSTIVSLADVLGVSLPTLFDFQETNSNRKHIEAFEEAKSILANLPTADLQLALEQIKAIDRRGR